MRPNTRMLSSFVLLALLLSPVIYLASPADSQSAPASQQWWDQSFAFRRTLTLTNPQGLIAANQPVVLQLSFGAHQVVDAVTDIRILNQSGSEVPSIVLYQRFSGDWVSSATLALFASGKSSSPETFYLYYGNPLARIPSYRTDRLVTSVSNGKVSVTMQQSRPGSDEVKLTYGSTFAQSIITKVIVANGPSGGFGSTQISPTPYGNDSGWHLAGNITSLGVAVAFDSVSAGSLFLTRALLVYSDRVLGFTILSGSAGSVSPQYTYFQVVNSSSLSAFGQAVSRFDASSGLYSTTVAGTTVGLLAADSPGSFDVGNSSSIFREVSSGTLLRRTLAEGSASGVINWGQGTSSTSPPVLEYGWTVGQTSSIVLSALAGLTDAVDPATGGEEFVPGFLPSTHSTWNGKIAVSGATVSTGGLDIPTRMSGGVLVAGNVRIDGSYAYALPGQSFAQSASGWSTNSGSTLGASASALTSFYSVDTGSNVARLSVSSSSAGGASSAALTSGTYTIISGSNPYFFLRYRAFVLANQGLPSNQTFYAAVDIDSRFSGTIDRAILLPVAGSLQNANPFACGPLSVPSPLPSKSATVSPGGYLIADDTWRTLNISLHDLGSASGFEARVRLCSSIGSSFVGTMQLLLSNAYLAGRGDAAGLLVGSASPSSPLLSVGYRSVGSFPSPSVAWNGNLYFSMVAPSFTNVVNGTAFGGTLFSPKATINSTSGLHLNSTIPFATGSLVIRTRFAPTLHGLEIGGAKAAQTHTRDLVFTSVPSLTSGEASQGSKYQISFLGYPLTITVADANNNSVSGVQLEVIPQHTGLTSESVSTGPKGSATVQLIPWNYTVTAAFQGVGVGSVDEMVNGQATTNFHANIYEVYVKVSDALHRGLPGAQLTMTYGNKTISGFTGGSGVFGFQGAANQVYLLSVSLGGSNVYQGSVQASTNNGIIDIPTTYLPTNYTVAIVVGIVVALTALGLLFYARRSGMKIRALRRTGSGRRP